MPYVLRFGLFPKTPKPSKKVLSFQSSNTSTPSMTPIPVGTNPTDGA